MQLPVIGNNGHGNPLAMPKLLYLNGNMQATESNAIKGARHKLRDSLGFKLVLCALCGVIGLWIGIAALTEGQLRWGLFCLVTLGEVPLFVWAIRKPKRTFRPWFWMFVLVFLALHTAIYVPFVRRGWLDHPISYFPGVVLEGIIFLFAFYVLQDRLSEKRRDNC